MSSEKLKDDLDWIIKSIETNFLYLNTDLKYGYISNVRQYIAMLENNVALMKLTYDKWIEKNEH